MADRLDNQLTLQHAIARAMTNLKKMGKEKWTKSVLQTRIVHLKEQWRKYEAGHGKVAAALSAAEQKSYPYFTEDQFEITEETYLDTLAFMQAALDQQTQETVSEPQKINAGSRSLESSHHLPRIQLPQFEGQYETWEAFRDRFNALIVSNPSLPDASRMHYLVSCLKGRALDCVSHLPVTDANFSIAWDALKSRYDNPRRLLAVHLSALLQLPALNRESASDLQDLRDRVSMSVASLQNLGRTPENLWNDILVHLTAQKLDSTTRKEWKLKTSDDVTPPSFDALRAFIDSRVRALEEFKSGRSSSPVSQTKPSAPVKSGVQSHKFPFESTRIHTAAVTKSSPISCPLCRARHYVNDCPSFLSKSASQRNETVKRLSRCLNCLSKSHSVQECASKYSCRVCQQRHHTLLHEEKTVSVSPSTVESNTSASPTVEVRSHFASTKIKSRASILLATAWVQASVDSGRSIMVRALIDQGSETSFVTESVAQLLRAKRQRVTTKISGVGGVQTDIARHAIRLRLSPRSSLAPTVTTTALVLTSLSTYTPRRVTDSRPFEHLADLNWADADPSSADPIHLILGSDIYAQVILDGLRKGEPGNPIAQNSIFGWIISGPVSVTSSSNRLPSASIVTHHCLSDQQLHSEMQRFWEVEEIPRQSLLTPDEETCERHFCDNTSRAPDGRYTVRLPFRSGPPIDIGHSRRVAEKFMQSLSRRFQTNPALATEYSEFLDEYERLGHMRLSRDSTASSRQCVFIPHHPVFRADSVTTHLRVVFNASSLTTNGSSLNDHLIAGPKLQTDLAAVILRWRKFRYVYTADIAKMYRQILIDERDVDYQCILWQPTSTSTCREYQLLTVTYGMTCAPYLALRVLQRLNEDEGHRFPLAKPILQDHIYVDDVLFGSDDVESIRQSRNQLTALLDCGKFKLRKWASNSSELLTDLDPSDHGLACTKTLDPDDQVKVLGVSWSPNLDAFQFRAIVAQPLPSTKRSILSTISKLYDPLGWVTPATVLAKILLQDIWRLRISWDEKLPDALLDKWRSIYEHLSLLNSFKLPRWIGFSTSSSRIELHGFADASTVAYAAVVYAKCTSPSGEVTISLLAGKSKVAPLNPLTIPRLELQGALLLSRLMEFVLSTLGTRNTSYVCWTDSTVVLNWVQQHPSRWKTFVANRVANIQARLPQAEWRHVSTEDNPADCASRGLLSDELLRSSLWWQGPAWLRRDRSEWPQSHPLLDNNPLEAKVTTTHLIVSTKIWELETRFSSWPKLIRVTAYIFRFVCACRRNIPDALQAPSRGHGLALSAAECNTAKLWWIRRIQDNLFPEETSLLRQEKPLPSKNPIIALNPFLDKQGILRVGGRLQHASLPFESKHPIILASHPLVRLIIENAHIRSLHAGLQLTLSSLRQTFWILRARTLAKSVIHVCVTCARERAVVPNQIMGQLPEPRVSNPAKCFAHCGLDYAGPVLIRASAGRGITSRKAYIALFICLATKAIHLELVADYSTPAFLNAYCRFCSRRGIPEAMYSDNGTTFIGANRELSLAHRETLTDPEFLNKTATDGVAWHFIPPSAPHFGGLWEAGVKSVKHHLRRVLKDRTLTFEEFTTLLCAIEACLNSRPIAPQSDSYDDFESLTPGHFLIGSALTVPPQPSMLTLDENRLSRWQLLRQMTERFWTIWRDDYVNTLQQRSKWRSEKPPIALGQLVLIRLPNLPPCKWELGRVTHLHPGEDGHTRVVTVRTSTGELKRPIVKLCPLPVLCDKPADTASR